MESLRCFKQRKEVTKNLGQSLLHPTSVRWNSLFFALEQIINLREKIIEATEAL